MEKLQSLNFTCDKMLTFNSISFVYNQQYKINKLRTMCSRFVLHCHLLLPVRVCVFAIEFFLLIIYIFHWLFGKLFLSLLFFLWFWQWSLLNYMRVRARKGQSKSVFCRSLLLHFPRNSCVFLWQLSLSLFSLSLLFKFGFHTMHRG